eukprot:5182675-Prymnesium_polylepis.2
MKVATTQAVARAPRPSVQRSPENALTRAWCGSLQGASRLSVLNGSSSWAICVGWSADGLKRSRPALVSSICIPGPRKSEPSIRSEEHT